MVGLSVAFVLNAQSGKQHTFNIDTYTETKIDKKKKLAIISPDSSVRRASYNHFMIPLAEYNKKVGKKTNVTVTCKELSRRKRAVKGNPMSQSPEGGIQNIEIVCRILTVKANPVNEDVSEPEATSEHNKDMEQRKK